MKWIIDLSSAAFKAAFSKKENELKKEKLTNEALQAELDMVIEPVVNPSAGGQRVRVIETRREFITNDQENRVSADRAAAHQKIVVCRGLQGLRQQDSSLQVIDVVIEYRRQVFDP